MKIAAWNVNSIRVRLPHVLAWLAQHQPLVLCLQELKCEASAFPFAEIEEEALLFEYGINSIMIIKLNNQFLNNIYVIKK